METNNPPNATDFAKKSPARNKRRSPKCRFNKGQVNTAPAREKETEYIDWFVGCLLLIILSTALKEMFDNPNTVE